MMRSKTWTVRHRSSDPSLLLLVKRAFSHAALLLDASTDHEHTPQHGPHAYTKAVET